MKKFLISLLLSILFVCGFISVGECREFVFVINSAQSMNNSDPQKRISESVAWAIANLDADDEAAVISFNDVPLTLRPLKKISAAPSRIFNLNYSGNSNAGDALFSAVDMLSPKFDEEKNIIFITDGEISLPDAAQTSRSIERFQQGLQQAEWSKMQVFILNLRNNDAPKNYQSYANLAKEIQVPHTELMTAMRNVIYDDFRAPHITLPVQNGNFSAEIPLTHFDKLKMFVFSANAGTANLQSFNNTKTLSGNFVNVFEITAPLTSKFDFVLNYPQATGLTLDAVPTVEGILQTEVETHLFSADNLKITPAYKDNPSEKIFADNFFENKPVRVKINDAEINSTVKGGVIQVDLPSGDKNISLHKVFFEDLGVNFTGENSTTITLPDEDYLIFILAGAAILAIVLLSFFLHEKNKKPEEKITTPTPTSTIETPEKIPAKTTPAKKIPEKIFSEEIVELPAPTIEKVPDKKITYDGKLAIYVTKTLNDEDIAPREFNLFRVGSAQLSLLKILEECKIAEPFQNIGDIFIAPARRGILLANYSDCTILKRGNLIDKDRQIELYYEDSISITTPDETAELILRYKSLRPN